MAEVKHDRITVDPRVMVGKPCIRGTRVPVGQVLRELAGGMTVDDILDAHPHLTAKDVYAAAAYADDLPDEGTPYPQAFTVSRMMNLYPYLSCVSLVACSTCR
jgi:uncharacterized protein (DUF433 family)